MQKPMLFLFLLSVLVISNCTSGTDKVAEIANTNATPVAVPSNPNWPNPDWTTDSVAALQNTKQLPFKAPGITGAISIPAEWTELSKKPNSLLLKSPTVDNKFANLILYATDTKPVMAAMPRPYRDFDYSKFEPDDALKHYQEMRGKDPSGGRLQLLTVGNLNGVLEQVIFKDSSNANSPAKDPEAGWTWTTFIKPKDGIQQIVFAIVYPASQKEAFKTQISGILNSLKFELQPETKLVKSEM